MFSKPKQNSNFHLCGIWLLSSNRLQFCNFIVIWIISYMKYYLVLPIVSIINQLIKFHRITLFNRIPCTCGFLQLSKWAHKFRIKNTRGTSLRERSLNQQVIIIPFIPLTFCFFILNLMIFLYPFILLLLIFWRFSVLCSFFFILLLICFLPVILSLSQLMCYFQLNK